jgi:ribosomal protein S4
MSDEIQQIYASRLHFQQKIKWFYGLLTTSSLNRHIYPYNSKRGLRSKKLMGLSFLSELERRLDILLYRLSLFPTIASARQAIQHKRIRI